LCLFLPKKAVAEGDWPPMGEHNDVPGLHPTEGVHICYEQSLYKETASVDKYIREEETSVDVVIRHLNTNEL